MSKIAELLHYVILSDSNKGNHNFYREIATEIEAEIREEIAQRLFEYESDKQLNPWIPVEKAIEIVRGTQ